MPKGETEREKGWKGEREEEKYSNNSFAILIQHMFSY